MLHRNGPSMQVGN